MHARTELVQVFQVRQLDGSAHLFDATAYGRARGSKGEGDRAEDTEREKVGGRVKGGHGRTVSVALKANRVRFCGRYRSSSASESSCVLGYRERMCQSMRGREEHGKWERRGRRIRRENTRVRIQTDTHTCNKR